MSNFMQLNIYKTVEWILSRKIPLEAKCAVIVIKVKLKVESSAVLPADQWRVPPPEPSRSKISQNDGRSMRSKYNFLRDINPILVYVYKYTWANIYNLNDAWIRWNME